MPVFQDTFTAAADQNLEAHTPDVGTSWTELWATTAGAGFDVLASTGVLTHIGADVTSSGAIYTANAAYPSADYDITVTMTQLDPDADDSVYLLVRVQDQENMYAVRLKDQGGANTCRLYKKLAGVWSSLSPFFTPPADGSIIKLEIIGSALKFYDDGVVIASATDTDITAAGKAGVAIGGNTELVVSTDDISSGNILDTLSVNDLAAGNVVVTPSTAALITSTFASVIGQGVVPPTLGLVTAAFAPAIGQGVVPSTLTLTTTTFAPTVTTTDNVTVTPTVVALTTTTFASAIGQGVIPSTVALTLTSFVPTVSVSDNIVVTPSVVALAVSIFTPAIGQGVVPPTLALVISVFTPVVTATDNKVATPDTIALVTTAFVPSVGQGVVPSVTALTVATFAPTVTVSGGGVVVTPPALALATATFAPAIPWYFDPTKFIAIRKARVVLRR